MCAFELSQQDEERHPCRSDAGVPGPGVERVPAPLVKAEANLLRLPLFALHTKGLKSLDGIECRGRIVRDGQAHAFTFRATRNTATPYPGPLARSAHLAFLSLVTEAGLPFENPLTFRWRDLCRRMGIVYGGQIVRHLKEAITATAGLLLQSEFALYSKADGRLIHTAQDALHLYDRVCFVGTPLPEGGVADTNYLWLSDWYLNNLNALFTAPLDYGLWRHLDAKSPIASRLYEFLLLNFYGKAPVLRINYETLVQFLPVRAERYRSSAKRQLESALQLLTAARVVGQVEWAGSKDGLAQLHLYRGTLLAALPGKGGVEAAEPAEEFAGTVAVKELRNVKPPEWSLVADFYRLWTGEARHRPTAKELAQAKGLLEEHGVVKAKNLIERVVKRMKVEWPEAKTFGAIATYLPAILRDDEREQGRAEEEREERLRQQAEEDQHRRKRAEKEELRRRWRPVWDALPDVERKAIEQHAARRWPHYTRLPHLLEGRCLEELARRNGEGVEETALAETPSPMTQPFTAGAMGGE